jgi:hypothetical protein
MMSIAKVISRLRRRVLLLILAPVMAMATDVHAEILSVYDTPKGAVESPVKDAAIWVKCFECSSIKEKRVFSE